MSAMARSDLETLRRRMVQLHRLPNAATAKLPIGIPAIDAALPGGGLVCGALHELCGIGPEVEHGAAAALLAAGLLARRPGPVLWVLGRRDLFAPALPQVGLALDRVLFVEAGQSTLLAMEEGLRHSGLAGVVGELEGRLTLTASRRLQLAAEASGVTGFALRRSNRFDDPALREPCAANTRWRIACMPSPPPLPHAPAVPGLGRAHWRLDLLRCRGGEPGSWMVEACDAQGGLDLVAALADRPSARKQRAA